MFTSFKLTEILLILSTANEISSQRHTSMPRGRVDPDVTPENGWIQFSIDHSVLVTIAREILKRKLYKRDKIKNYIKHTHNFSYMYLNVQPYRPGYFYKDQ